MDSVVDGITIHWIQIQVSGYHEQASRFGRVPVRSRFEVCLQTFHQPMLDTLPAPARVAAFVVGLEGGFSHIWRRGDAHGQICFGGSLAKCIQEPVCLFQHNVNSSIDVAGVFRVGSETVVDSQEENRNIRALSCSGRIEIFCHIQCGGVV